MIESYDKESRAIKEEALKMCWFMRGGLTYEEAMYLSQSERELISKLIKSNIETTKESGLPFF
jgi:hypothetical protein